MNDLGEGLTAAYNEIFGKIGFILPKLRDLAKIRGKEASEM